MRTTIYINRLYYEKLKTSSEILSISKNEIISFLLTRITNDTFFKVKPYETVQYQKSNPDINWKTAHIDLKPVFYEKAQDLKRNFKFSVSWFITFAIINYLDDIVKEMTEPGNQGNIMDNYDQNFIYIAKSYGKIQGFITLWGVPEEKYLNKLLL